VQGVFRTAKKLTILHILLFRISSSLSSFIRSGRMGMVVVVRFSVKFFVVVVVVVIVVE